MRAFLRKIVSFFIIYSLIFSPVIAKEKIKMTGNINEDFTLQNQDLPDSISFVLTTAKKMKDDVIIPEGATVNLEVINARRELRWHVSGLILCKILNYVTSDSQETVDLSDKDIYIVIKKYEPINGKDAGILTSEIILTQAAGVVGSFFIFFAPVDIVYFFAKGAIKKEKHPHWFKAGVRDAYDNSIFWFQLKGKPIELETQDSISANEISSKKALKLNRKIAKRAIRENKQNNEKILKLETKYKNHDLEYEKKEVVCEVVQNAIENELNEI